MEGLGATIVHTMWLVITGVHTAEMRDTRSLQASTAWAPPRQKRRFDEHMTQFFSCDGRLEQEQARVTSLRAASAPAPRGPRVRMDCRASR